MNATANASSAPLTGPQLDNRRVIAGVIDLAIVAAGALVVMFAGDALGDSSQIQGALGAVILGWALYYYFALESGDGQTVGKRAMKLRVVRADGTPATMRDIAVRTVVRVVDGVGMYIVGLIVMLATGQRRQRLGDLAAGTVVADASGAAPVAAAAPAEAVEADEHTEDEADEAAPAESATISLPARPEPPVTIADVSAPAAPAAPAVPELRPFPPVEDASPEDVPAEQEPVAAGEPRVEAVEDEPVDQGHDAPVVELPRAEEPVEEPEDAPVLELAPRPVEPVAEQRDEDGGAPEVSTPSLEQLARDVAAARAADNEALEEAEKEEDEPVRLRSVETVSAIDLVMGGASEEPNGPSDDDEPRPA